MMLFSPQAPERPIERMPVGNFPADTLWALLGRCWGHDADSRPMAAEVEKTVNT